MIKLSIILPVYNVKDYLERCLNSVLQSCGEKYREEVEIILVDDGATDGSGPLCDQLSNQNEGFVFTVHKKNGGLASARNEGLRHANGEYVFFIDSDDWIEEDTIPKIMKQIEQIAPDIIQFGYNRIVNNACDYHVRPGLECRTYDEDEIKNTLYYSVLGNGRLFDHSVDYIRSAWASVYKMELFRRSGILFESERIYLNEDILFNLKIVRFAKSITVISDCLYNYDCRQGSLTQCRKADMFKRKCALLDNYLTFAKEQGITEEKVFKGRYSQFVIHQLYDCAVSESNWNPDKKDKAKCLTQILSDSRMKDAFRSLDDIQINKKAFLIRAVMETGNPYIFDCLYKFCTRNKRKN